MRSSLLALLAVFTLFLSACARHDDERRVSSGGTGRNTGVTATGGGTMNNPGGSATTADEPGATSGNATTGGKTPGVNDGTGPAGTIANRSNRANAPSLSLRVLHSDVVRFVVV